MSYKTTDGLMRHLRDNGISISGSTQKRQLMNTGYYHGYKGYRFFKSAGNPLPFTSYQELYATIAYDSALKSLFYGKMMFIETAVKNIALQGILENAKSESIQDILDRVVCSYNNSPESFTTDQKKRVQQCKLNLQRSIQSSLASAYSKGNPKITHFYNNPNYSGVPIWAYFEIMTMGDLGFFLSCLTFEVREDISKRVGLDLSNDTSRQLLFKYIYALKDLRNAIAHNAVVFDTRFRNIDPTRAMTSCLKSAVGLPYVNFKTIGDYVPQCIQIGVQHRFCLGIPALLLLHLLHIFAAARRMCPDRDLLYFCRIFFCRLHLYAHRFHPLTGMVIHPDLSNRMEILTNFI